MLHRLSIIIPVFNEATTVYAALERTVQARTDGYEKEIIIVNDGSTDGTKKEIQRFTGKIIYIEHAVNEGKGSAVRTGIQRATGDLILIQDADMEYNPDDISRLLERMEDNPLITAVYGSRNLLPGKRGYGRYILGVWFLTFLVNILFRSRITDCYTCYKLVRTDALRALKLTCNGFEIEMEITAQLLARGYRIAEVPISYQPRTFGQGKKIRAIDGLRGIYELVKVRLGMLSSDSDSDSAPPLS